MGSSVSTSAHPPARAARPQSLSPSRAADFQQCPLMYRLRVIDRLPEEPSEAATRGTVVHAVLERVFDAPAAERTVGRARAMVTREWERLLRRRPELATLFAESEAPPGVSGQDVGGGDATPPSLPGQSTAEAAAPPEAAAPDDSTARGRVPHDTAAARLAGWLADAELLVERWFSLEDPTRLEPTEREMRVETRLESGLRLRGVIDRVDIAPTGEVRIVDYKTGKAPRAEFAGQALFQMKFYALVIWRLKGVLPRRLQMVYLGGGGDILTLDPQEEDLLAVERKLLALWEAIRQATDTGDWRPRRSRLCGWCSYQEFCPEFGGTPPPYPLLVQETLPLATGPDSGAPAVEEGGASPEPGPTGPHPGRIGPQG